MNRVKEIVSCAQLAEGFHVPEVVLASEFRDAVIDV